MNTFVKMVIGEKKADDRKNFIWNMTGSGIYSFISMFLTIAVIRIMGEKMGGIFSIALTISQMLLYIAYFEMRLFQVTDVERTYCFAQYHGAKIITCLLMMAASVVYIVLQGYAGSKMLIVFLMCIYRMTDGYADLYEGQFQLNDRLYLAGKSLAFRSIFSSTCFVGALILLKVNTAFSTEKIMIMALCIAVAAAFIGLWAFDILIEAAFGKIAPSFEWKAIKNILKECFPLFIGAFLWVYILSASRFAIDRNMADEYQAYYQTMFMPVSVINLFATFFFKPALMTLSECYSKREKKAFYKKIGGLLLIIAVFTLICMLGAFLLGIPVLSAMSGCDLSSYRMVLVFLMLAGGLNSLSFFLYYILTIMRKPKSVLAGYGSAALLTLVISSMLVQKMGIWGAGISFFLTVGYLSGVFSIMIIIHCRRDFK